MSLDQFFKDETDAYSMKRLAFFAFVFTWIVLCFFHYPQDYLASCERMVVWLGGYILAEDVAPAVAKSISK